jgi:hypothetical protein
MSIRLWKNKQEIEKKQTIASFFEGIFFAFFGSFRYN